MVASARSKTVIEILEFLINHLSFFIADGRYRFVDSEVSKSFGGDAYITLESKKMRWRIVRDRAQFFLEFQSAKCKNKNWYTTDILQKLMTGSSAKTAEMDPSIALFLGARIDEIESLFEDSLREKTLKLLSEIEKKRAKERFG
jgi:hypothetical protein